MVAAKTVSAAVAAELAKLNKTHRFRDPDEDSYVISNGTRLSWRELAERNVANAERYAANLADMVRSKRGPGSMDTQRAWMEGDLHDNSWSSNMGQRRRAALEAQYPGVTKGKRYVSALARFPNDPAACIDDPQTAMRMAREQGKGWEGRFPPAEAQPVEPVPLAEDVIRKHMRDVIVADPGVAQSKKRLKKLREETIASKTPRWKHKHLKG